MPLGQTSAVDIKPRQPVGQFSAAGSKDDEAPFLRTTAKNKAAPITLGETDDNGRKLKPTPKVAPKLRPKFAATSSIEP